jgi:hypothetical protein
MGLGMTGVGAGASVATGLGSTVLNFAADLNDGTMSTWDAIKNAGTNVGFDLLGSVGGIGKAGKVTNTLIKFAPRVLAAIGTMQGVANAPTITASFKKVLDPNAKLTV